MSTNSLISSSNVSLHPPPSASVNSSSSSSSPIYQCFDVILVSHIFTALFCSYILFLLPLCVFILHLGHLRWHHSASAASNADIFTYNIVIMEMLGTLGSCFFCAGTYADAQYMRLVAVYLFTIVTPGQMMFHVLTCVEHYLAVVHPITYLGLRKPGGVRIRNISIGCVWVSSFGWVGITVLYSPVFPSTPFAAVLVFSVIATSFCSLSVLRALIRPAPGEGGGDKDKVDQLKRRAFHTIIAITGALLLRFVGQLVCVLLDASAAMSYTDRCVMLVSGVWSSLPSSYVLPLLFLHRARKLQCLKYNSDSGQGSIEERHLAADTRTSVSTRAVGPP